MGDPRWNEPALAAATGAVGAQHDGGRSELDVRFFPGCLESQSRLVAELPSSAHLERRSRDPAEATPRLAAADDQRLGLSEDLGRDPRRPSWSLATGLAGRVTRPVGSERRLAVLERLREGGA